MAVRVYELARSSVLRCTRLSLSAAIPHVPLKKHACILTGQARVCVRGAQKANARNLPIRRREDVS
jgi:hypothetical protein